MYVSSKIYVRSEYTILIQVCGDGIELLRCIAGVKDHIVLAVVTFIVIKLVESVTVVTMRV